MALLRMSLLKLGRRVASWVVLVVLLAILAMFFLAIAVSVEQIQDPVEALQIRLLLGFPNAYFVLASMILSLGGLLAVIYGASIIGADWAWGTIRTIIARGESRVRYTLVTFAAIALMIGIGIGIAFVFGAGAALLAADIAGVDRADALAGDTLASLPGLVGRTWLGVAEQAAIGFAVAMLFKSQLAGIGAGLAIYFGQVFLGLVPGLTEVLQYSPIGAANAVIATADGLGDDTFGSAAASIDGSTALVLASAYLVIALGVACVAAWRAEITQ